MLWRCRCQIRDCKVIRHKGQIENVRIGVVLRISDFGAKPKEADRQVPGLRVDAAYYR